MTFNDFYPYQPPYNADTSWFNGEFVTRIMGFSFVASLFQGLSLDGSGGKVGGGGRGGGETQGLPGLMGYGEGSGYVWRTVSLFLIGLLVELGRRFSQWLFERMRFRACVFLSLGFRLSTYIVRYRIYYHGSIHRRRSSLRMDNPLSGMHPAPLNFFSYHLSSYTD
jgi:hypothetical protein